VYRWRGSYYTQLAPIFLHIPPLSIREKANLGRHHFDLLATPLTSGVSSVLRQLLHWRAARRDLDAALHSGGLGKSEARSYKSRSMVEEIGFLPASIFLATPTSLLTMFREDTAAGKERPWLRRKLGMIRGNPLLDGAACWPRFRRNAETAGVDTARLAFELQRIFPRADVFHPGEQRGDLELAFPSGLRCIKKARARRVQFFCRRVRSPLSAVCSSAVGREVSRSFSLR